MARQRVTSCAYVTAALSAIGLAAPAVPQVSWPIVGDIVDHMVVPGDELRSLSQQLAQMGGISEAIDWQAVGAVLSRRAGVARPVSVGALQ